MNHRNPQAFHGHDFNIARLGKFTELLIRVGSQTAYLADTPVIPPRMMKLLLPSADRTDGQSMSHDAHNQTPNIPYCASH